jgi:hypothetical protein
VPHEGSVSRLLVSTFRTYHTVQVVCDGRQHCATCFGPIKNENHQVLSVFARIVAKIIQFLAEQLILQADSRTCAFLTHFFDDYFQENKYYCEKNIRLFSQILSPFSRVADKF